MAKKKAKKKRVRRGGGKPIVIEILRHLAGPPRRSPGQRLVITSQQIKQQGLKGKKDFRVIKTAKSNPATL